MPNLSELLSERARRDGQRPLLTFYDTATGERTELSASTFDNWVSKTANLLADELGVERGGFIALLPATHWTTAVVLAACWRVGAAAALGAGPDLPDLVVQAAVLPEAARDRARGVRVPVLLLGEGFGGRMTGDAGDALDFGKEVPAFDDDYLGPDADEGDDALVLRDGRMLTQAELLAAAAAAPAGARRVLSTLPLDGLEGIVAAVVAPLATGGSCVLVHGEADLERIAADEQVDGRAG